MCKSCFKTNDIGKPWDLILQNHVINNKPNMQWKINKKLHHILHLDNMECMFQQIWILYKMY